jgi:hypothetical protein
MAAVRFAFSALLTTLVACSGETLLSGPSGGELQASGDMSFPDAKRVVVLTVDDEPTDGAASIRALATRVLANTLEQGFGSGDEGPGVFHAADIVRSDLRVVVVHPSIAGSERAVGPSDDAALALTSPRATIAQVDAVAAAASREIDAVLAPAGAVYPLLDATALTLQLLTGLRAPVDAREQSLVASVGPANRIVSIVVTSRDDGGPGSATAASPWAPSPEALEALVVSPLGSGSIGCAPIPASTRLGAWMKSFTGALVLQAIGTQCPADMAELQQVGISDGIAEDGSAECLPRAVARRADGTASCVITATLAGGASYELTELSGAQAAECSNGQACADCAPGWCTTPRAGCGSGGVFSFVQGAVPTEGVELHWVCDETR